MDKVDVSLDVPSPPSSYRCQSGDHDRYLETSHSESHSSATSPYDMTFSRDFAGPSAFSSPETREADDGFDSPLQINASGERGAQPKTAAKRKRENRYKNAPPSVLSRRRAQNRASQRAYRERKDQRIKDLEQMLSDARARNDILSHAYAELQAEYIKLKSSSAPATHLDASHGHSHSQHLASSMTTPYAAIPGASVSTNMNRMFVDATTMAVLNAGHGLESYLYTDVGGYAL